LLDLEMALERVREGSVAVIQIPKSGDADRGAKKDAGWDRREHEIWIRERRGVGLVDRNNMKAAGSVRENAEGATDLIGELSGTVMFVIPLNLHPNKDEVTNSKYGTGATGVDTIAVSKAAVSSNERNN
jgi:hypothetical protein